MVLAWLMADPMLTGQQAMHRLEREQPGLYGGSLRALQRRMAEWRVAHAEQVMGQQMGAIRDLENSQLTKKEETVSVTPIKGKHRIESTRPMAGVTSPGACRCHSDGVIRLKAAGLAAQHVQNITRSRISQIHLIPGKLGLDTIAAGQLQVGLEIAP